MAASLDLTASAGAFSATAAAARAGAFGAMATARAGAFGARAAAATGGPDFRAKARAAAQDFEATFLNSMFSQMMTAMDGEGPFGGGPAIGVWRSFLTDEYAKSFARAGGIGIADHVYRSLIATQEASR
jgi:Rod binding domain-containing protein